MADDREFSNVYTIPPNYTDSGKLLGGSTGDTKYSRGMHSAFACGLSELMWMHLPATCKSCCDDRDAVATGRLCRLGMAWGLSAPGLSPIWFCFG